MDGNPQSLRLEGKPSDGRSSALVATVVLPARFISAGMFRRHTDGRRRKRLDLPSLPGSPSSLGAARLRKKENTLGGLNRAGRSRLTEIDKAARGSAFDYRVREPS